MHSKSWPLALFMSTTNSLLGVSFMEVNADMNSTITEKLCTLTRSLLLEERVWCKIMVTSE